MGSPARSLGPSELLAERWASIILRNIVLVGCRSFNDIADGVPGLSRGLLSKRLRDLERAGVINIRPKPERPGSTYEPTQAGREFSEIMLALQRRKNAYTASQGGKSTGNAFHSIPLRTT